MARERNVQLTVRDRDIVAFLCRYWVAHAQQIRREFFGSMPATYRRLAALARLGLLEGERVFYRGPKLFWATRFGALYADADLSAPRGGNTRLQEHALAVLDLSFAIREGLLDPEEGGIPEGRCEAWVSEREIRRDKMAARRDGGSGRMNAGKRLGRTPDGVLILDTGEQIAVELELHAKRQSEYERILSDYRKERDAGGLDGVRFFFPSVPIMRRVEELARRRGLGTFVEFHSYAPVPRLIAEAETRSLSEKDP